MARMFWVALWLALILGLNACAGKTTPPGANMISGSLITLEGLAGSYTILQWREGLSISIVDDRQGSHESSGSGSTDDPIWRGQGKISTENGRGVTWRVETTDGKTAQFYINEQAYDLTEGTLFLIKTNAESPQIMQYQSHQNGGCSNDETCQRLLMQDAVVLQFTRETLELTDQPSPTEMQSDPTMSSPIAISEAWVPAGWMTYTSQQCEYEISYPAEMEVHPQTPYSDLLVFNLSTLDEGPRNFVYVSVITPDIKRMAEQGVYNHDVYNYDSVVMENLLKMEVGESKSVHASLNMESGFTYQRQPDTMINGYTAQTYENIRPWEFPEGTKETRYYISLNGCTYLIGGYMDTAGSNLPGVMTEELFKKIVATIRLIP